METDGVSSDITSTNRSCGRITAIIGPDGVEYSIGILCPKGTTWLDFITVLIGPANKGVARASWSGAANCEGSGTISSNWLWRAWGT